MAMSMGRSGIDGMLVPELQRRIPCVGTS
jgi:hypothetical protein